MAACLFWPRFAFTDLAELRPAAPTAKISDLSGSGGPFLYASATLAENPVRLQLRAGPREVIDLGFLDSAEPAPARQPRDSSPGAVWLLLSRAQ
jgi:hypothetical protein